MNTVQQVFKTRSYVDCRGMYNLKSN